MVILLGVKAAGDVQRCCKATPKNNHVAYEPDPACPHAVLAKENSHQSGGFRQLSPEAIAWPSGIVRRYQVGEKAADEECGEPHDGEYGESFSEHGYGSKWLTVI